MKCWLARIVIYLVLGVVTTVVLAWGCMALAVHGTPRMVYLTYDELFSDFDREFGPTDWYAFAYGDVVGHEWTLPGSRFTWRCIYPDNSLWAAEANPRFMSGRFHDRAVGLPFAAMGERTGRLYREGVPEVFLSSTRDFAREPRAAWNSAGISKLLELRPIWPGFVIDALFYSAIWFGIFLSFGSARRALRKHRGRCPQCNYDLRGELDKGCSECGWGRE